PFLEKLLLEACLEALEVEGVVAMQDLGAAGLTSSIVECASKGDVGIEIDVQRVSRRERGMSAYEVMLSESQERMLIVVTEEGLPELRTIFERWDLHSDVIGKVTDDGNVRILDGDTVVADVPASLYTDECPVYVREGVESPKIIAARERDLSDIVDLKADEVVPGLLQLLASHNVCSREPVIRTYDHTIMSNTVTPPLEGDAGVVRVKGTNKALAVTTDCNPRYVYLDPFLGGQHAVAEAARNVSCTGAEPLALTNCLNFGSPEKPEGYFQLQQAVLGMAKAAEALGTPVVSGNVSLYNESGDEAILPTPTVGMVGLIEDVSRRAGLAPSDDSVLLLIGQQRATLGASEFLSVRHGLVAGSPPELDLSVEHNVQLLVRSLIADGLATAAHDTSEGGLLVALAEMLIASETGATISLEPLLAANDGRLDRTCFGEAASRVIVAVSKANVEEVLKRASDSDVEVLRLGTVGGGHEMVLDGAAVVAVTELRETWESGLSVGR
ncbi:MAG TPA: AIR synthase-related protein, partial [Thermomicrobiales bacterium]|nr:AIR synthase-related protein [Thermomicrobiales bacterium]